MSEFWDNNLVLAMYDVRGKQDFIYRSNKCKEIVGGSQLIADVFRDYLLPAAEAYCSALAETGGHLHGIYAYDTNAEAVEPFSAVEFQKRMEQYIGEVVYEGGGNFFIIYRNKEACIGINKIFTKRLLEKVGTLKVLCTYVEGVHFDDYRGDERKLRERHRVNEAQESVISPVNATPFTAVSPENSRPFTAKYEKVRGKGKEKVTTEQLAKYEKYNSYIRKLQRETDEYDKEEYLFDNLVEEKGVDSLLAVIYIDGNGMGAKVAGLFKDNQNGKQEEKELKSYDDCVTKLREFSSSINRKYVLERKNAITEQLERKYGVLEDNANSGVHRNEGNKKKVKRTIVAAGDEMTIICNAHDALDVVNAYFAGLMPEDGSSCAGVVIFHSHAPYADAYRIAEECCESAKSMMKKAEVTDVNLMDFHYCQGGIGISLENIRRKEGVEDIISRPWRIDVKPEQTMELSPVYGPDDLKQAGTAEAVKIEDAPYRNLVNEIMQKWKSANLARSNVKTLREAAQEGAVEMEQEFERINAHRPKNDKIAFMPAGLKQKEKENYRKLVFDVSSVYDLWFRKE